MPKKDVLIYGAINEYSSAAFIEGINTAIENDPESEIDVLINTNGGSPECGWGMIAKFQQLKNKNVINHGKSYSMGAFFNCYVEKSSALDVCQFLIHRAAYASWIESDPEYFTESMRTNLDNINKNLRKAFEAKVDVEKFENLKSVKDKGITVERIFSMDERVDVFITAKEAKQIGLINEIISITPKIQAEIESHFQAAASYAGLESKQETKQEETTNNNSKPKTMTVAELKASHPETYNSIFNEGVNAEKDRVGSIMAFADIDPEGCKAAIKSGEKLSETQRSEFMLKGIQKNVLTDAKAESTTEVETQEVKEEKPEDAAKKAAEASFMSDVKAGK